MSLLNPTPPERMLDAQGRPYFLWDLDMTLDRFLELLREGDPETRAYFLGKLMRQAKPDDVLQFVTAQRIRSEWSLLERHLGRTRAFWEWLLAAWEERGIA